MRDLSTVGVREDQIELELPASADYGRVIRIAAANLALRRGFSLAEIDDLRLVMDEAAALLLGPELEAGGRLAVTYSVRENSIDIDARILADSSQPLADGGAERFAELVGHLIDSYKIDETTRQLTLTKSRANP